MALNFEWISYWLLSMQFLFYFFRDFINKIKYKQDSTKIILIVLTFCGILIQFYLKVIFQKLDGATGFVIAVVTTLGTRMNLFFSASSLNLVVLLQQMTMKIDR